MEVINLDPGVKACLNQLVSVLVSPPVPGQALLDLVVNPPQPGEPSYNTFIKVRVLSHQGRPELPQREGWFGSSALTQY